MKWVNIFHEMKWVNICHQNEVGEYLSSK